MSIRSRLVVASAAILVAPLLVTAHQTRSEKPAQAIASDPRIAGFDAHQAMVRASPFGKLEWSFLGPTNVASMTFGVAVADRGDRRRIYVIYRSGGLWKSDDQGASWQHVTTGAAEPALNAIAVAPSNPDVVWLGTGAGFYKSIDAARTWTYVGLPDLADAHGCPSLGSPCGRIVIHPGNPDTVYVALTGPLVVDSPTRGVYKTTDGGKTWRNVLFRNSRTGAVDLVIDPRDPETLYAATWQQVYEQGWAAGEPFAPSTWETSGGTRFVQGENPDLNQTSVWKTTNGGGTWTEIDTGLPVRRLRGRIGIDVARSNPQVLYALVNTFEPLTTATSSRLRGPDVYRTDDQGQTWRRMTQAVVENVPYSEGFGRIRADPKDDNTVFVLGVQLRVSRDGGRQFRVIPGPHGDHKDLWVDPKRDVVYDCTDGGLYIIENGGASWSHWPSPTAAFYNIALDNATPFHAYGSVQDYQSFRVTVDLASKRDALAARPFEVGVGIEFSYHAIDPGNPDIVFASPAHARLMRFDLAARTRVDITPVAAPGEPALRGLRLIPLLLSPHDPQTVYVGYQHLYRSKDRGDHWERISEDLTDNDPEARRRPPFRVQSITAIAESPRTAGVIYAGSDNGRLHVTKDGGRTWSDLTKQIAPRVRVSNIVASASAPGTVYVVQGKVPWRHDDMNLGTYVLESTDYGQTFTNLAANIPIGPASVIREDPTDPNILYLGTRLGVYVSTDGGRRWEVLGGNLPTVFVSDLQIHPRDQMIVIATFGRGVWVMDATKVRAMRK